MAPCQQPNLRVDADQHHVGSRPCERHGAACLIMPATRNDGNLPSDAPGDFSSWLDVERRNGSVRKRILQPQQS
jgi:hypothetical protein